MTRTKYTPVKLTVNERAALEAAAARSHGGNVSEAMRLAIRAMYMPDATPAQLNAECTSGEGGAKAAP